MARMEFTGKKTMKANGWNVIVLMGDDIKNRQRLDALNSSNDNSMLRKNASLNTGFLNYPETNGKYTVISPTET